MAAELAPRARLATRSPCRPDSVRSGRQSHRSSLQNGLSSRQLQPSGPVPPTLACRPPAWLGDLLTAPDPGLCQPAADTAPHGRHPFKRLRPTAPVQSFSPSCRGRAEHRDPGGRVRGAPAATNGRARTGRDRGHRWGQDKIHERKYLVSSSSGLGGLPFTVPTLRRGRAPASDRRWRPPARATVARAEQPSWIRSAN